MMLTIALLLIHFVLNISEGKSYLQEQGITDYDLVQFDLNALNSSGVIGFSFNGQVYEIQLEKNENMLPIVNRQHPPNMGQIWYVFVTCWFN